jgi:hypothetical protein
MCCELPIDFDRSPVALPQFLEGGRKFDPLIGPDSEKGAVALSPKLELALGPDAEPVPGRDVV